MKENLNTIEILIAKSISGIITIEEAQQLEQWKNASKSNYAVYINSEKAWKLSNKSFSESDINQDKNEIQYAINKALRIRLSRIKSQNLILKIAAILILPVTVAIIWYFFSYVQNSTFENQYCEIISPKGNISKCMLPDGTEVWINTNSKIRYNTTFFLKHSREIEVIGEAYFLVSKNKDFPFKVNTEFGSINVTGTEFNVKSYPESNTFETVLSEGNITLNFRASNQQSLHLFPGERAILNKTKDEVYVSNVDSEIYSAWRNGEIIFKDATLNDLIKELERIYDIRFYLENEKIGEFRFRGMFSYNNNLIDALEKIKKTASLDYIIENKQVRLTKK